MTATDAESRTDQEAADGERIRTRHGVPAHVGARVEFLGKPGRVVGFFADLLRWEADNPDGPRVVLIAPSGKSTRYLS